MTAGVRSFAERLSAAVAEAGAPLCVGLDPDPSQLPSHLEGGIDGVRQFCLEVIAATGHWAAAFKPNIAFYERFGAEGWLALIDVISAAREHGLVIVDAKRGDIGHTAAAYAETLFATLGADACTANPYLGHDAVTPLLSMPGRVAFVLCRTSNPGAADFQDLAVGPEGRPLYLEVARRVVEWDRLGPGDTAGLVVGATWPAELHAVRTVAPTLPILIPGVGAQGGDLAAAAAAAAGPDGRAPFLLSISRGIASASRGRDFAEAAAAAASRYHQQLSAVPLPF